MRYDKGAHAIMLNFPDDQFHGCNTSSTITPTTNITSPMIQ